MEELSKIAQSEPQAALSCYSKSISHRWKYIQRTIPDIGHLFLPLENTIRNTFIPAIIGRNISDNFRKIFSLPVRLGGMGIEDPSETSQAEYTASKEITENLTSIIYRQDDDFTNYDRENISSKVKEIKRINEDKLKEKCNLLMESLDEKSKKIFELAQEKGAGAWITALPIKALGFSLNKQEFRDSVFLRYGWTVPNTPAFCSCGTKNTIDHALSCKKGGFIIMRHNKVRDVEAELLREICHDVQIEPELLPLDSNEFRNGNNAEKARLDVSGIGVWGPLERTFLDVRIMHPTSPSYVNKSLKSVYLQHEIEEKVV